MESYGEREAGGKKPQQFSRNPNFYREIGRKVIEVKRHKTALHSIGRQLDLRPNQQTPT